MKVPNVKLNNGLEMPQFGLGTWMSDKGVVQKAVEHAISVGYRHIDTAFAYGNEGEVGAGIAAKIADGTVKRSDIFVTTKLWNIHHHPDAVARAIDLSLKNLGLDYVDIYMMHFPMAWVASDGKEGVPLRDQNAEPCAINGQKPNVVDPSLDYVATWAAMEKVVDAGKAKSIAVSNFNSFQLKRLLDNCRIKPVTNQIEINPYLTMTDLVDFCQANGVAVTAYSPLGNPSKPPTRVWDENVKSLLEDDRLTPIAKKYNKSVAQVLIRFALDRGLIVIPKSTTPSRIESNSAVFDFSLTADEVATILKFNKNFRIVEMPHNLNIKYFPWNPNYSE